MPLRFRFASRRGARLLTIAVLALGLSVPGWANLLIRWTNTAGGSSTVASNWNNGAGPAPGPADDVMFNVNAAYNVSWAAPNDTVASMVLLSGRPRFNSSSGLRVAGQVVVSSESLTVLSGLFRCGHYLVASGNAGRLFMTGLGTQLVAADSTSGSYLGDGGTASVWVQGAASLQSNGWVTMGFTGSDRCTTTIIGGAGFPRIASTFKTLSALGDARRGDVTVADNGFAALNFSNGGFGVIAGDLYVGRHSTGIGTVRVYNTQSGTGSPFVYVAGNAYLGSNEQPQIETPGGGSLLIEKSLSTVVGTCTIGSGYSHLTVKNGASLTSGGIVMSPTDWNTTTSFFTVTGPATQANVSNTFQVGTGLSTGIEDALADVDSGATLNYSGPAPIEIGHDGALRCWNGATLQSSADLHVLGELWTFGGTIHAPRIQIVKGPGFFGLPHFGHFFGWGLVAARVSIADSTAFGVSDHFGVPALLIAGDSTATDGFVSAGNTFVYRESLMVLDQDGADLGNVSLGQAVAGDPGGTLMLPQGGRIGSGFSLTGWGRVEGVLVNEGTLNPNTHPLAFAGHLTQLTGQATGAGTLQILPGAALTARGAFGSALDLRGALDLGPAPATLALGSGISMTGTASTRIRIGSRASGVQDAIAAPGAVVSLGGTLDLRSIPGNMPAPGDTITLITAGAIINPFTSATINGGPAAGQVSLLYSPLSLRVVIGTIVTAVPPGGAAGPVQNLLFAGAGTSRAPAFTLELPQAASAWVAVYDVTGREVARLVDGALPAGRHELALPRSLASGVYFGRAVIARPDGQRSLAARVVWVR